MRLAGLAPPGTADPGVAPNGLRDGASSDDRQLPRVFPPFRVPVPELAPPLLKAFSGAGAVVVTAALVTNELAKAAAPAGCQGEPPCAATLAEFLEGYVTQHRTQCTRHVCMVVDVVTGTRRCATCTSSRCR